MRVFRNHYVCRHCWKHLHRTFIRKRSSVSWTSSSVRTAFLDFFCRQHDHQLVSSSSIIAKKGEGSYFINAGMNQVYSICNHSGLSRTDFYIYYTALYRVLMVPFAKVWWCISHNTPSNKQRTLTLTQLYTTCFCTDKQHYRHPFAY